MEILQRDQQTRLPLTLESGSRYILFRLSPLESETAGTQGLLILLSDITDQVLAQQELEVSRASLETAYRQLESTNQKLEQQIALVQQQAAQLEGANAELQRKRSTERDIGARVQQSLLVPSAPQDLPGVRIASLSVPSQQVDGDFCDFYTHSDLVFDLVVGDVMGKGLSAALLGAATKTQILRSVNYLMSRSISPALPTPETLVQQTHRWITPNLIQLDTFVTLTYARFDLKRELATLVDCGHTSTIHYRAETGECCLLTGKGLPLGVLEEETYCQFDVPIAPGDLFIFYSDGITEARNRQGQMYGIERLQALIGRHALESPASITEVLHQELDRFTGATHFADDVTCIVVAIDTTGQLQGWHETEAVLDPVFVTEAMLQQLSSSALWGSLRN
jgi:serine phosphatase RsbU (regulator of sigma subunit)